jgi:hypothetical protein
MDPLARLHASSFRYVCSLWLQQARLGKQPSVMLVCCWCENRDMPNTVVAHCGLLKAVSALALLRTLIDY